MSRQVRARWLTPRISNSALACLDMRRSFREVWRLAALARRAEEIGALEVLRRGDLHDRIRPVVELHPKGAGDHGVHIVEAGDVGELEDLHIVPERLELVEHFVGRAT